MKYTGLYALCACVLVLPLSLSAQTEFQDYVPVVIHQTVQPTFPPALVAAGIKSGSAKVAVAVDASGKLTDYLVIAYTNPAFAEQAVAAVKKWTFEPALVRGNARNSKTDVSFQFEVRGIVLVSLTVFDINELVHYNLVDGGGGYKASTLGELDRIPTPRKIVNPTYPADLARRSQGGRIAVEFYIDQGGHVRMPSVSRAQMEENEALSAIAVAAVGQWEFDPPLRHGQPVLVLAEQNFEFKPPAQ